MNYISYNRTYLPQPAPTRVQKIGAAIGVMLCGALLAAGVFYSL
jgi:hypothetical protein